LSALAMWTVNPLVWMWITARLESGGEPPMGPYGLLLSGIVATCVALGKLVFGSTGSSRGSRAQRPPCG
jgi:hypothetical protein